MTPGRLHFVKKCALFLFPFLIGMAQLKAEGSVDFVNYPGYRLFYNADIDQQLKVYVEEGEYIQFGTSHLDIERGFMVVYRPDGSLYNVYDGKNNQGIIHDHIQELNGPDGGGTVN